MMSKLWTPINQFLKDLTRFCNPSPKKIYVPEASVASSARFKGNEFEALLTIFKPEWQLIINIEYRDLLMTLEPSTGGPFFPNANEINFRHCEAPQRVHLFALRKKKLFFRLLTLLVSLFESNLQRWFCDFWSWRRLELWLLCCYSFLCHRFSHIFVHLQRVTITTIFEGFHDQKLTSKKKVDVEPRREYRSVTVDDRVCEAQKNWQLALSWGAETTVTKPSQRYLKNKNRLGKIVPEVHLENSLRSCQLSTLLQTKWWFNQEEIRYGCITT